MEIWLDSVDADTIRLGSKIGISGVTTNPSIIADSEKSLEDALEGVLKSHRGPVTAQVLADDAPTMIEQGETLRDFSERIIVKIPVTLEGLKAIAALNKLRFPVMATAIFTPLQALLACRAGADYLAPYFSRIEKEGSSAFEAIDTMLTLIEQYEFKTKVVVASLKTLEHICICLELGVHAVTLKEDLFEKLLTDHASTLKCLEQFTKDWKNAKPSRLL